MKHLTFCSLLFLTLVLFCFGSMLYVTERVLQTETQLEQALQLYEIGEKSDAAEAIKAAASHWEHYEKSFGTILRHDEIDHVNGEFARLLAYADSKDHDDFRSTCATLLSDLAHIREMEQPIWPNIL